jgi:rhamnosyltransferase
MNKIAGVTIVYNPVSNIVDNIKTYIKQVELLYIIDNSEIHNPITDGLKTYGNIRMIVNNENKGIAAALNAAAKIAIKDGYDFLLTMDQDSTISDNLTNEMLKLFEKDEKIGVLSPYVVHMANPKKPLTTDIEKIMVAMTSGSIIRLSTYKKIAGFEEKLFIDYVDHEYCLRIKSFGYKVMQLNSVCVYHNLGDIGKRKLFFRKVFPTNHTPLRWYYRTRNRLYVRSKYKEQFPDYVKRDRLDFLKETIKIFLYEKDKFLKFRMIIKGYFDYKRNQFGMFEQNN